MDSNRLVRFLREINKLKEIQRTGWIRDGVKNPESVADHCFLTVLMTLIIGKYRKDIDLFKAVKMALVHDIVECKTGDLVLLYPEYRNDNFKDAVTAEVKKEREQKGMEELVSILDEYGQEYLTLWKEYGEGKTPEARFVKQIDRLENGLQALEYENSKNFKKSLKNLEHYFQHFRDDVNDPFLRKILEKIISERKNQ
jgi:putative hydrolase of HD superfamily